MKIRSYKIILLLLVCFSIDHVQGQILSFDGMGRVVVTNDKLAGNLVNADTVSAKRGVSGYTVFDFGVKVRPTDNFVIRSEFRARNNFGQFFGAGTNVNLRQFRGEGVVRNKLYYSFGDIDVGMTAYTVYAPAETFYSYESELFSMRRQIVNYENFVTDSLWRVQGVSLSGFLPLDSMNKIAYSGFGARTRQSNNIGVPDRFLAGVSAGFVNQKWLNAGINYVGFFDNAPSTDDFNYQNHVLTSNYKLNYQTGESVFSILGESGYSIYDYSDLKKDTGVAYTDYFIDLGLKADMKKVGLDFQFSYINVGPQFSSPSAQTQRISPTTSPDLFPTVLNATIGRNQTLFDRFTQERMYNQSIAPVLFKVLPQYGNVLPYGRATPNRKGYNVSAIKSDRAKKYRAEVEAYYLTDIIGEGTDLLRKYILIKGGANVNIHQLLKLKRKLNLSSGVRYENTSRGGFASVDFTSIIADAGVTVETLKDFDLLLGIKYLQAKGNEYVMERDQYNYAVNYTDWRMDLNQAVIAGGVKLRFNEISFVTLQCWQTVLSDQLANSNNYRIRQWFVNYSLKF